MRVRRVPTDYSYGHAVWLSASLASFGRQLLSLSIHVVFISSYINILAPRTPGIGTVVW